MSKLSNKTKGVLLLMFSSFGFAFMAASVQLAGDLPAFEKSFFRNLIAAVIAAVAMKRKHVPFTVPEGARGILLLRLVVGTIGVLCNFYALSYLKLADANMLSKLSPFFTVLFSIFLLKEKIHPVQALTLAGAFVGAMFIIKPTGTGIDLVPGLAGLLGGAGAGCAYACVRKCTMKGVEKPVIVLAFSVFCCLVSLLLSLRNFVMPNMFQLAMLLLCGCFAAIGQFSITAAYSYAPSKEISIFDYSQIIFSTLLGFFLFGQVPDGWSFVGYAVIICMAVINFLFSKNND